MVSNYNMAEMRKEYITLCAITLNKVSKFYAEDYENICRAANRYTRQELIEALNRQKAIASVSATEISANCVI